MYDVIIIGAGPSGCSAAKKLAVGGAQVLLIERFKLPRNKSCSGILIKKSMDLVTSYFGGDIPRSVMCWPNDNRGMVFTDDEGKELRFEQQGLNILRCRFDYWLAQKAVDAGAQLRDETAAVSFEEHGDGVSVKLKGKTEYSEKAKIVIDCGGVASTARRKLTDMPKDYIITYQTFNRGSIELDPHYFYAYLQPEFSEYDAWFNVKDDYLIFGVAVEDQSKIKHCYNEFIKYMKSRHNAHITHCEKSEKWLLPRIASGCAVNYGKGRVLFAGEAAGFLNPMGEGISSGLECGYAAAKAVEQADLDDLDIRQIYLDYKNNTEPLRGYMMRQWNFVASHSNRFSSLRL